MSVNLNHCRAGDRMKRKSGRIVEYARFHAHNQIYRHSDSDGAYYANDGRSLEGLDSIEDIVAILPRDAKKPDEPVNQWEVGVMHKGEFVRLAYETTESRAIKQREVLASLCPGTIFVAREESL